jgi:hypothetical protein
VAVFCDRFVASVAADEDAEVAAGDPFDCCDGLGVSEVVGVEGAAEAFPVAVENEEKFVAAEGAVVVGEAEAAVELGVVPESLVDSGHADEDHREVFAVVSAAEQLESRGCESFGFVDDEEFDEVRGRRVGPIR